MSRRRLVVAGIIALAVPLAAEAQRASRVPKIGFLQGTLNENAVAFVEALRDAGYVDGQNTVIETRIYGVTFDRLPQLAKDLVTLKCDVIFATGPYAIKAVTSATQTLPIIGLDLESDEPSWRQLHWAVPRSSRIGRQADSVPRGSHA